MTPAGRHPAPRGEIAGLTARRDALRQAAAMPDADLRLTLEAALAELDGAIEVLATAGDADPAAPDRSAQLQAERRLLRAVFRDAPVPLFVLGPEGTVRRINRSAARLLGLHPGYTAGKPFSSFVNFPSRAAVQTQLAAVLRTRQPGHVRCELLTVTQAREYELTAALTQVAGDADDQILVAAGPPARPVHTTGACPVTGPAPRPPGGERDAITSVTHRSDVLVSMTRLLSEDVALNEAITVERCARLLAGELACWVVADLARGGRLLRQFVMAPGGRRPAEAARAATAHDPQPGSVPWAVHQDGGSVLVAHVADPGLLGDGPDGVPLLMQLGATSVLSVPLLDAGHAYGVLTLARQADPGHFGVADLGLVEQLGEQLARAITVSRLLRRQAGEAGELRAGLIPPRPPLAVPGVEIAAAHFPAATVPGVGGDFYDVYRDRSGWGVAIGEACGRGEGVAAAGTAARHAIRVAAHSAADPARVLTAANQIMLAEEFGGRFVTACAAHMRWWRSRLRVTLATAGHPPPAVVRPDGEVRRMAGGGLPLGLFAEPGPAVETCELARGDVLIFVTDGLANARDAELGSFGDRLAGEVVALAGRPPGRIVSRLREAAVEFCRGDARDDITVVALSPGRRPPGPAPGAGTATGGGRTRLPRSPR